MESISSVGELIRVARNGRSQKDFAALLGLKQSSVSRYEIGKASPPIGVIEHGMRLTHTIASADSPAAEPLAESVRVMLADPDISQMRLALSRLLDAFARENKQKLTVGSTIQ